MFNPLYAWLTENYGYRVALRCSAALITLFGVTCCGSYAPKTVDAKETDNDRKTQDKSSLMAADDAAGGGGDGTKQTDGGRSSVTGQLKVALASCCLCFSWTRHRPETVFWYFGNLVMFLGRSMPFLILVSSHWAGRSSCNSRRQDGGRGFRNCHSVTLLGTENITRCVHEALLISARCAAHHVESTL